jgi:outer membrane protein
MTAALAAVLLLAAGATAGTGPVLTLDEAVKAARQGQPALRQARAATAVADARVGEALAGFMPRLDASLGYLRGSGNQAASAFAPSRPDSWSASESWKAAATASMTVWDSGATLGRYQSASATATAQQATERATMAQVLLNVRTAFFAARARRDLVTVAEETLANQEAHLKQTEGFVSVGTRPQIDLAQARTDRANAEVSRIGAVANYQTAKAQLNQAMGIEATTEYDVADDQLPAVEGEESAIDQLVDEALKSRPEVAALEAQLRAQEWAVTAARGGWWPSLGVSAGLTDSGPELAGKSLTWNWSAGATLSWNLFQGGMTRSLVREAEAGLENARAQAATLRLQVRLDLEQARFAVSSARAKLVATEEAITNARERLRLAEGRYYAGSGSALEQGDAQLQVTLASAQKVSAQYDLSSARAQLLAALGRP